MARGEFGNVVNTRIEQKVDFDTVKGRYIKLKGTKVDGEDFRTTFGEIGVITQKESGGVRHCRPRQFYLRYSGRATGPFAAEHLEKLP